MPKTLKEWNEELESLRERASEREYLERRSDQLNRMLRNARNQISKLTAEHDREQEDVARLERNTWTNLFHSIMGNKEERLEIERKEALTVALKLQEAQPAIIKLEQENLEVSTKLAAVHEAMNAYKQVLLQKEQFLRSGDPTASGRLSELDESLFREQTDMKEFREAASACRKLVEALSNASVKLDSAKDWGTYDMLGGGALSTSIKHSRMDEAQDYIHEAQHHLRQLQIELIDLKRTAELSIELGTMDKFADYFLDNLITDWIVQNQIKSSISDVNSQLSEATDLLVKLDNEVRASERRQEAIRQQRAAFIELFD